MTPHPLPSHGPRPNNPGRLSLVGDGDLGHRRRLGGTMRVCPSNRLGSTTERTPMVSFEAWRSGKRLFVAGAERVGVLLTREHVSPGDEIVLRVVEAPVAGDSGGAHPRVTGAAIKELLAHLASHPDRKVVITARGRPVAALNEPDNKAPGVSCSFCGK